MRSYLGECNLKGTRPDGECCKILVSNPEITIERAIDDNCFVRSRWSLARGDR